VSTLVAAGAVTAACGGGATETPAGGEEGEETEATPETEVEPTETAKEEPSGFNEAPMLAEMMEAGELPPVVERIPLQPYVVEGIDGIGNYGGTWRMLKRGMADGFARGQVLARGPLRIDRDLNVVACMCESWEVSDDGTEFTFYLRKGMKWSDGEDLTAEDYRFWYEDLQSNREYTPAHPKWLTSVVDGEYVPAEFSAPDDYTVKYKFARPNALFHLQGSIVLYAPIAPAHFLKQFHADYADEAELANMVEEADLDSWVELLGEKDNINFTVERPVHFPWVPVNSWGDEIAWLKRNPYYWEVDTAGNQLPYIDWLRYHDFQEHEVAVLRATNGEIDCQSRHTGRISDIPVLMENEERGDYTVMIWRATRVYGCHFNMTTKDEQLRELFQERDFRIAVSLSVDRAEVQEMTAIGYGTPMQYTPPKDSEYHSEKLANAYIEYDPDRANELLDGLGYISERDDDGYRLFPDGSRVRFTCLGGSTEIQDREQMLVEYLSAIGLEMNYKGMDRTLRIDMHQSNEVQMTTSEMDRNLIPLADPQIWTKHTNINDRPWANAWTAWYIDPTHPIAEEPPQDHWIWDIWNAWEEIQATPDKEQQKVLWFDIMDIWARELPSVGFFGDFPRPVVVKNGFKGIEGGYPWDCCRTVYEHLLDNATWYWENPEEHTFEPK
jgi:peptide/nickel transport system substrate-binding protein